MPFRTVRRRSGVAIGRHRAWVNPVTIAAGGQTVQKWFETCGNRMPDASPLKALPSPCGGAERRSADPERKVWVGLYARLLEDETLGAFRYDVGQCYRDGTGRNAFCRQALCRPLTHLPSTRVVPGECGTPVSLRATRPARTSIAA